MAGDEHQKVNHMYQSQTVGFDVLILLFYAEMFRKKNEISTNKVTWESLYNLTAETYLFIFI